MEFVVQKICEYEPRPDLIQIELSFEPSRPELS